MMGANVLPLPAHLTSRVWRRADRVMRLEIDTPSDGGPVNSECGVRLLEAVGTQSSKSWRVHVKTQSDSFACGRLEFKRLRNVGRIGSHSVVFMHWARQHLGR
jgi:hypothetical protein